MRCFSLRFASLTPPSLQILPRSHKFPINADGDQLSPEERPVHAPAEKRRFVLLKRGKLPRYRWHLGCILLKMPAISFRTGEVIVLHNWMLHRSEVNSTPNPRRGFSVCYIDAATSLHSVAPEERNKKLLWPKIFPSFVPATQEEVDGAEVRHVSMLDSQQVSIPVNKAAAKL